MEYKDVSIMPRQVAETALASGKSDQIVEALLSVTFHDADWHWVQSQCLGLIRHDDASVRAIAITCLGHLARIHHQLDTERVLPLLRELSKDPALKGRVQDTLDDIRMFIPRVHWPD